MGHYSRLLAPKKANGRDGKWIDIIVCFIILLFNFDKPNKIIILQATQIVQIPHHRRHAPKNSACRTVSPFFICNNLS